MRRVTLAFSAAALLVTGAAWAQEKPDDRRENPFVPPPTEAEEQARMDERMRNIVWQLQPEIKSLIMQDVTAAQASLEIKMRRRIDTEIQKAMEGLKAAPSVEGSAEGILGGLVAAGAGAAAGDTPTVPEGAKFISCVNGKALYRDKDNTLFQVAGNGVPGSDRCAD